MRLHFFRKLKKRSLVCRERVKLKAFYPIWSTVRLSLLKPDNHPSEGLPLSDFRGRAEQLCSAESWEPSPLHSYINESELNMQFRAWNFINVCSLFCLDLHCNCVFRHLYNFHIYTNIVIVRESIDIYTEQVNVSVLARCLENRNTWGEYRDRNPRHSCYTCGQKITTINCWPSKPIV